MQEYLNQLRNESVYIKLEAKQKIAGAIDIESLVKVLNAINQSYRSFLEIKLKDAKIANSKHKNQQEIKHFIKDNELLIVDLDFASFGAAISPNTLTTSHYGSIQNGLDKKKEVFQDFKNDVFYADFSDDDFVKRISEKYSGEERAVIYKPFLTNIYKNTNFNFYCGTDKNNLKKSSKGLNNVLIDNLIPKMESVKIDLQESTYALYVTVTDENDLFGKKLKYSNLLATEKLEFPVYPFQLSEIKIENHTYVFNNKLSAEVSYEEDLYFIKYPDLNIEVWGDDRTQAEDAFRFMLKRIIVNIFLEKDENLTEKALLIKGILSKLIKSKL